MIFEESQRTNVTCPCWEITWNGSRPANCTEASSSCASTSGELEGIFLIESDIGLWTQTLSCRFGAWSTSPFPKASTLESKWAWSLQWFTGEDAPTLPALPATSTQQQLGESQVEATCSTWTCQNSPAGTTGRRLPGLICLVMSWAEDDDVSDWMTWRWTASSLGKKAVVHDHCPQKCCSRSSMKLWWFLFPMNFWCGGCLFSSGWSTPSFMLPSRLLTSHLEGTSDFRSSLNADLLLTDSLPHTCRLQPPPLLKLMANNHRSTTFVDEVFPSSGFCRTPSAESASPSLQRCAASPPRRRTCASAWSWPRALTWRHAEASLPWGPDVPNGALQRYDAVGGGGEKFRQSETGVVDVWWCL